MASATLNEALRQAEARVRAARAELRAAEVDLRRVRREHRGAA